MSLRFAFAASSARRLAYIAGMLSIMSTTATLGAAPSGAVEGAAQANWRDNIANLAVPAEGCFMAEYPSLVWMPVGCVKAPARPFLPRSGSAGADVVGNGHDYALRVTGLLSKSVGTFPLVSGVTSETGIGGPNDYSLQLNSNFMTTAVCNGHSGCQSWQQFIYSSGEQLVFMQYWLIGYGSPCPAGWTKFETDCYTNSRAVTAPVEAISSLQNLKITGTAVKNARDSVVLTTATLAYSTSGQDSMVDLATGWKKSEFNIVGDGDASAAVFNTGSYIRVKIVATDGSTAAPACAADSGTTGETNNLNLRACTATGGTYPSIAFVEALAKTP
jgi:hypothetical protein